MSNYVNFWVFFFSIKIILRSLFSPWKKIESVPQKTGFDIVIWANNVFFDIVSRVIGFIMRVFLLGFFVICEVITLTIGVVLLVVWLFLPLIIAYIIIYSFSKMNV
ncbi:MAG: hypothetical protein PHR47_01770 [Candidatus Pacebacteria bacterium]|nr:hypothetical protein [Candidatus Paceibacterota bacterium]